MAKADANGFSMLWRYFSWVNAIIAVFALAMISIYMIRRGQPWGMALLPGMFYMYITCAYILNAPIGFQFPGSPSYILAAIFTLIYVVVILRYGRKSGNA